MTLRTFAPTSPPPSLEQLVATLQHLARRGLDADDMARGCIALELRDRFGKTPAEIARDLKLTEQHVERLLAAGAP